MYQQEVREPLCLSLFHTTLVCFPRYIECLKYLGTQWVGLRLHFPILQEVVEHGKESEYWVKVINQQGFLAPEDQAHAPSDWSKWHFEFFPHRLEEFESTQQFYCIGTCNFINWGGDVGIIICHILSSLPSLFLPLFFLIKPYGKYSFERESVIFPQVLFDHYF